jgi:Pyruvate/2-oxoacid:ferredoxin oxidoreductase delta subunit
MRVEVVAMEDVYKQLAKRLDELPNGFPSTETGLEITILKKIFSREDAEMALKLKPIPETVEAISERLGVEHENTQAILDAMVEKGQIGSTRMYGNQVYILVPFIFGIYEFQLNRLDKELSDLVGAYAPTFMRTLGSYAPALSRVVPVNAQIQGKHQVHRYEDAQAMMEDARSFQVMECICRKDRALHGHPCTHDTEVCLAISTHENAFDRYPMGRIISREEALRVIARAEEQGLVHTTYNVQSEHLYMCNCCSCCCGLLRGMKYFKVPHLIAGSNFRAFINTETCQACGVCATERCPVNAIVEEQGVYRVLPERCIGCGVCTSTCPTESIALVRKPEQEQDEPPQDVLDWFSRKADSRGIKIEVR